MAMRTRLRGLEQATQGRRDMEISKAVFAYHMECLRAMVDGRPLPPRHPQASDPRYAGTFFSGDLKETGPVADLSE